MGTDMHKYRFVVDLDGGSLQPQTCEIVQVIAGQEHYRDSFGGFHPVAGARLYSGERYIVTGLHDGQTSAMAEALAELRRRGERLLSLADKFEQHQEHGHD